MATDSSLWWCFIHSACGQELLCNWKSSEKLSSRCCQLSVDNLGKTVLTQIRTDILSVLIWIQTVWHSDSCRSWKNFLKELILKNIGRRQQKHERLPRMQRVMGEKYLLTWNDWLISFLGYFKELHADLFRTLKMPSLIWYRQQFEKNKYITSNKSLIFHANGQCATSSWFKWNLEPLNRFENETRWSCFNCGSCFEG